MIEGELAALLATAAGLGFIHTLLGPDHYVPFIAISRARQWTARKTAFITGICGLAHVGSSVVIGIIGLSLSYKLTNLEAFEAMRGNITGWLFMAFGLAYLIWGIRQAVKRRKQEQVMENLQEHSPHKQQAFGKNLLPWSLFVVFLFGPCEPLIPLLMFPAANISSAGIALVAGIFGTTTIATMLVLVMLPVYGVRKLRMPKLQPYGHALAGMLILLCGLGIQFGL